MVLFNAVGCSALRGDFRGDLRGTTMQVVYLDDLTVWSMVGYYSAWYYAGEYNQGNMYPL